MEDLESRDGSFGSTSQNFEKVDSNFYSIKIFRSPNFENLISSTIDLIDPRTISMNNVKIRLLGSNSKRCSNLTELLDFEKRFFNSDNGITNKLPMMEIYNLQYDSKEIDDIENDETSEFSEKIKTPELSEKDKTALLVADLCENK